MTELKPIAKGLATMVPGLYRLLARPVAGNTDSADYCYSVWLKHLTLLWQSGMREMPSSVAELGPGESLGSGFAALLSGASRFYALDVVSYSNTEKNLRVFDELVERFKRRAPRPIVRTTWSPWDLVPPSLGSSTVLWWWWGSRYGAMGAIAAYLAMLAIINAPLSVYLKHRVTRSYRFQQNSS
ncbi:MAG: hypothetical protein ACR2NO_00220 [Chloroflexota bacterium]